MSEANTIFDADIELYPHEMNQCKTVMAALYRKFVGQQADLKTLESFAIEAQNRFAEVGLKVDVDIMDGYLMDDGTVVPTPSVTITERVTPEVEHDRDLHAHEVQHGELDGIEGRITLDGRLIEPKRV